MPLQEEMFFFWEAPEIDKPKDISASILVKKVLILLQELETKVENGKEPEEEDDNHI